MKEFRKHVVVTGFRDAKIEDVNAFLNLVREKAVNVEIQILDANLIAGWEHVYFAVLNSLKAFEAKLNISNSLAMEILLYASAHRQIDKAIDLLGVKPGSHHVAVVIMADTLKEAESAIENLSKRVFKDFQIFLMPYLIKRV